MIQIDGSEGEGGGQILRSSLALSLLTGKPFKLINIRANRPKSGLAAQHLACVRAASQISGAIFKGGSIGSTVLHFEPAPVKAGNYRFPINTAGATTLVLHTVYLPLILRGDGPSTVQITGGTHVMAAPSYHFLETTWAGYLAKLGINVTLKMIRAGFYPRGGGEIEAVLQPASRVRELNLTTCPTLTTAGGFTATADLPASIGKALACRLKHKLKMAEVESHIPEETWSNGPGAVAGVIFRQAPVPTVFTALGERGRPAEAVADAAVEEALEFRASGCPVDPHSADQILLPLAFSDDASEFAVSEVTNHLLTNIATIRRFVEREITCEGFVGGKGMVGIAKLTVESELS